ncbi:MAG TPA: cupin domain-containing protein [Candidatus Eremiobacteraceae bacterium]
MKHEFEPDSFAWAGVNLEGYRAGKVDLPDQGFRGVTRQTITSGSDEKCAFEVRYFEIEPGGYTRLERHEHVHSVTVLRGQGYALVGADIHPVRGHDHIYIPPKTLHQFVNDGAEAFGFICVVDAERDRPILPDAAELAALDANPATRGRYRL